MMIYDAEIGGSVKDYSRMIAILPWDFIDTEVFALVYAGLNIMLIYLYIVMLV